jgi:hypothetical protein
MAEYRAASCRVLEKEGRLTVGDYLDDYLTWLDSDFFTWRFFVVSFRSPFNFSSMMAYKIYVLGCVALCCVGVGSPSSSSLAPSVACCISHSRLPERAGKDGRMGRRKAEDEVRKS